MLTCYNYSQEDLNASSKGRGNTMIKKDQNDGIGNHPEVQKIKDICDISPSAPESKDVCKTLNKYRKSKLKNR